MIAHRLSSIINCEKIFVIHEGEVKEAGTHAQLLSNHSYYYQLIKWQLQRKNSQKSEHLSDTDAGDQGERSRPAKLPHEA